MHINSNVKKKSKWFSHWPTFKKLGLESGLEEIGSILPCFDLVIPSRVKRDVNKIANRLDNEGAMQLSENNEFPWSQVTLQPLGAHCIQLAEQDNHTPSQAVNTSWLYLIATQGKIRGNGVRMEGQNGDA